MGCGEEELPKRHLSLSALSIPGTVPPFTQMPRTNRDLQVPSSASNSHQFFLLSSFQPLPHLCPSCPSAVPSSYHHLPLHLHSGLPAELPADLPAELLACTSDPQCICFCTGSQGVWSTSELLSAFLACMPPSPPRALRKRANSLLMNQEVYFPVCPVRKSPYMPVVKV